MEILLPEIKYATSSQRCNFQVNSVLMAIYKYYLPVIPLCVSERFLNNAKCREIPATLKSLSFLALLSLQKPWNVCFIKTPMCFTCEIIGSTGQDQILTVTGHVDDSTEDSLPQCYLTRSADPSSGSWFKSNLESEASPAVILDWNVSQKDPRPELT